MLARDATELGRDLQQFSGRVASLLFDGANSAVLVREQKSNAEIRIALPQTGRYADLQVGETIAFGFDAALAVAFPAAGHG
jgi:spermidine/putrescine transport system ATP-binding protein